MNHFLLEVSWEVANKVGGIYTVLKEKARYIEEKFKDNYFVVGPYIKGKGFEDFYQFIPTGDLQKIISETEKYGIKVYYGEWLIEGRPKGFLVDFENLKPNINVFKYELWEKYKIDSARTGDDYNEPILWCKAVSVFLKNFCNHFQNQKIVVHAHEWLSGGVILFETLRAKTIFTIHATVLGRALAGLGVNFWENLNSIKPDEEAYKLGIEAKHSIEKHSSKNATFFTAVSNVLGMEAENFLGRKPDFILPNGLNFERFPTVEEITYSHRKNREILKEFALFFFAPYYRVDIKDSLIVFISGRPEIKNKGIDVFIKSLAKLNKILKPEDRNIFVFLFIPGNVHGESNTLLSNLNIYRGIENHLDEMSAELKSRLIHYLIHKKEVSAGSLFTNEEFLEFKKLFNKIRKEEHIPFSTHIAKKDDSVANLLKESGLSNKREDRVKIIYYPTYVNTADGLLNISYENAVSGSHIGVFPSFYEPWGYTALETAAAGVLTITTDVTGFADFVQKNSSFKDKENPGIFILKRKGKSDSEAIEELTSYLEKLVKFERPERMQKKLEARGLVEMCSWKNLIKNYYNLYNKAFND